jgi:hypothetical protein
VRWFAVLWLVISGCGRVGFDTTLDASHAVSVRITQQGADPQPGTPIPNAAIVVEGSAAHYTTASDGSASFDVTAPATVHIGYDASLFNGSATPQWRLYTVNAVVPGDAIAIGIPTGDAHDSSLATMKIALPVATGATQYSVALSLDCVAIASGNTTMISLTYYRRCSGQSPRTYAIAKNSTGVVVGELETTVTLAASTTYTVTGPWTTFPNYTFALDGMAGGTVLVELAWHDASTDYVVIPAESVSMAGNVGGQLTTHGSSDATTVVAVLSGTNQTAIVDEPLPVPQAGVYPLPSTTWLALMTVSASATTVSWTLGAGEPGTLAMVTATVPTAAGSVSWTAYGDRTLRAATYPVLPSPLDGLAATGAIASSSVHVGMISSPGYDYARALGVLDFDVGLAFLKPPGGAVSTSIANP